MFRNLIQEVKSLNIAQDDQDLEAVVGDLVNDITANASPKEGVAPQDTEELDEEFGE